MLTVTGVAVTEEAELALQWYDDALLNAEAPRRLTDDPGNGDAGATPLTVCGAAIVSGSREAAELHVAAWSSLPVRLMRIATDSPAAKESGPSSRHEVAVSVISHDSSTDGSLPLVVSAKRKRVAPAGFATVNTMEPMV